MKVYEISTLAKPPNTKFENYAVLAADDSVWDFMGIERGEFAGSPFSKKWRKQQLYVAKPKLPRADFFTFGFGRFVCNERARKLAGEPLEMAGELLPVTVEGEKGKHWLYNVTNCINVVDDKKSKWRQLGKNKKDRIIERPAFVARRFGEECLFKIPEDGAGAIYALERTGVAAYGEFKAVVEQHKLMGLAFKLIWSDEQ